MCDEHARLTRREGAPAFYTESQLWQRMSLAESPMNHYLAPMLYYWISANTVVLNIQEQCFISIEDFDRGHFFNFLFFRDRTGFLGQPVCIGVLNMEQRWGTEVRLITGQYSSRLLQDLKWFTVGSEHSSKLLMPPEVFQNNRLDHICHYICMNLSIWGNTSRSYKLFYLFYLLRSYFLPWEKILPEWRQLLSASATLALLLQHFGGPSRPIPKITRQFLAYWQWFKFMSSSQFRSAGNWVFCVIHCELSSH